MVTSHPHMEGYVVLPTRPAAIRADDRNVDHDLSYKLAHEDQMVRSHMDQSSRREACLAFRCSCCAHSLLIS